MSFGYYDIGPEGLAWVMERSPSPKVLDTLVCLSRHHFGWFSKQTSRAFEGPWILSQIGSVPSMPILDIGAGVSPLPLFLAEEGSKVVTVDHSPIIRRLGEDQDTWNDWGYLDYACLNRNIHSLNDDILAVGFSQQSFSYIYSVSVVEHMPSSVRRQLWSRVGEWLAGDGVLLLTIDLFPGSEQLWNYSENQLVEPFAEHGDLTMLERELSQVGFKLTKREFLRDLLDSRVDVALLRFVRS